MQNLQMRALTIRDFIEVSREVGIDGFTILRRLRIHPNDIVDPERRLEAKAVIKALELAAAESGCDNFGILMARRRSFEDLGSLSLLMQHLETPRDVVEASMRYRRHFNDLLQVEIKETGTEAFITWDLSPTTEARQAIDHGLAMAYWLLTGSSGNKWRPFAVHATHAPPKDVRPWRQIFDCRIEFNSPFNGFSCSKASLSTRNPRAHPLMAAHALNLLKLAPIPAETTLVADHVRQQIEILLPEGRATLPEVANKLSMSPRKLQRQLKPIGSSFGQELEGVKLHLAEKYLRQPSRSISNVADMLGYASTAAFSRWFTSRTGQQPSLWRKAIVQSASSTPPPIWRVN